MSRRRAWQRLLAALLVTLAAVPFAAGAAKHLRSGAEIFQDRRSQSAEARRLLERATGADPETAIVATITAGTPETLERRIKRAVAGLGSDPHVAAAIAPGGARSPMRAASGRAAAVRVRLEPGDETASDAAVKRLQTSVGAEPGVLLGGPAVAQSQVDETVAHDLARAEAITFPILFILLLWVFRGAVAAFVPLLIGGVSIALSLAMLGIAARFANLSIFAMNLVTGLGLGLAIDYGLLIVSRFREELDRQDDVGRALERTMSSAGHTVLVSSVAVSMTTATLLMFPVPFISSMGAGGLIVGLSSGAVALVVLPALLVLLGPQINRWSLRRRTATASHARWGAFARFVMDRPLTIAVASTLVLVALSLPLLGAHFSFGDASVLPRSQSARQVDDQLARDFGPEAANPVLLVHRGPASDVVGARERLARIAALTTPSAFRLVARDVQVAEAGIAADPMSARAEAAVRDARAVDASIAVDGLSAHLVNLKLSIGRRLPAGLVVIGLVLLIAVMVLTDSLALAIKTLLVNVLSIGATLGLVVLVFQHLLGYGSIGTAEPIVLSVFALALATDYGAFLLGRVREEHDRGHTDRDAIARGLEVTGRMVTAAAILFCVAMSAFLLSSNVYVRQVGFGVAAGVLIDAFVVRSFLVPSTMCLLGRRNWWAPGFVAGFRSRRSTS